MIIIQPKGGWGITYFWRGVVMTVATRVAGILTHILKRSISFLWLFDRLTNIPLIASFLFFLQLLFNIRLLREGEWIKDRLDTTKSYNNKLNIKLKLREAFKKKKKKKREIFHAFILRPSSYLEKKKQKFFFFYKTKPWCVLRW